MYAWLKLEAVSVRSLSTRIPCLMNVNECYIDMMMVIIYSLIVFDFFYNLSRFLSDILKKICLRLDPNIFVGEFYNSISFRNCSYNTYSNSCVPYFLFTNLDMN